METLCIRLTSGEEIIGKIDQEETTIDTTTTSIMPKGVVTLGTVRGITFQQVGQNQLGIAFIPFAIANSDAKMTFILENCAAVVYPPSADLERGYLEQTSGISLARPGIQL